MAICKQEQGSVLALGRSSELACRQNVSPDTDNLLGTDLDLSFVTVIATLKKGKEFSLPKSLFSHASHIHP